MPGLVPGIHVLRPPSKKDVDGRDEPGHDRMVTPVNHFPSFRPTSFSRLPR
jgi:hypothetical protein